MPGVPADRSVRNNRCDARCTNQSDVITTVSILCTYTRLLLSVIPCAFPVPSKFKLLLLVHFTRQASSHFRHCKPFTESAMSTRRLEPSLTPLVAPTSSDQSASDAFSHVTVTIPFASSLLVVRGPSAPALMFSHCHHHHPLPSFLIAVRCHHLHNLVTNFITRSPMHFVVTVVRLMSLQASRPHRPLHLHFVISATCA